MLLFPDKHFLLYAQFCLIPLVISRQSPGSNSYQAGKDNAVENTPLPGLSANFTSQAQPCWSTVLADKVWTPTNSG